MVISSGVGSGVPNQVVLLVLLPSRLVIKSYALPYGSSLLSNHMH